MGRRPPRSECGLIRSFVLRLNPFVLTLVETSWLSKTDRSVWRQAGVSWSDASWYATLVDDAGMSAGDISSARTGDESAFRELVEPYRRQLHLHCYRLLGSLQDAEDIVQETLLAAWRGLSGFEERASLRTWLYRIATNRCLNALRDRRRQPQEVP